MSQFSLFAAPEAGAQQDDLFWRLLSYFNIYRIILGTLFLVAFLFFGDTLAFGTTNPLLFILAGLGYLTVGAASVVPIAKRSPDFNLQLALQVCFDIVFIVMLMHASGGIKSGLGLLLLVSLAASGLIQQGRLMLFFASLASIFILLEHSYDLYYLQMGTSQYAQAGMLSIGYYAMAALMRVLAQSSRESVELARRRGVDLASMAQINHMVIQDLQDGILVVDAVGKILSWNHQAESLLAIEGKTLQGGLLARMTPRLFILWQCWLDGRLENGDQLASAKGRKIRVRFVPAGESSSVIFLEDWDRIQDQARQIKLAALGRLTANIAHEIRNPLSSITYATELLLEDASQEPIQSRLLQIILDNSKRLDNMVQDILRFNRKDRANSEVFGPEDFFPAFLEQFCKIHKVPHQCFALEMRTARKLVFDKSHLNQVMWNLCRNAWHHSRKREGSIRISVDQGDKPDLMEVDILDDGPGVPEALRSQLFEPFFTTAEGGTGLGLYIAREVAEVNGASLGFIDDEAGGHFRIRCQGGGYD